MIFARSWLINLEVWLIMRKSWLISEKKPPLRRAGVWYELGQVLLKLLFLTRKPRHGCVWLISHGRWLITAASWLIFARSWLINLEVWLIMRKSWLIPEKKPPLRRAGVWHELGQVLLKLLFLTRKPRHGCVWLISHGSWLITTVSWLIFARSWLINLEVWLIMRKSWLIPEKKPPLRRAGVWRGLENIHNH